MSDPRRRIEALRAKAESTTFPAEAEALLAKATELEAALPPEPERISGTNWMEQMILDSLRASGRITVSGNTFIPHGTTIYITWS